MTRTLDDIPIERSFPPPAKYQCFVVDVEFKKSAKKGTPSLQLTFCTGENEFTDDLFITAGALPRLCLVAKRICEMPKDTPVPDDDLEAANFLAKYISENIYEKHCIVEIEEYPDSYIPESGPNMGRKITKQKRRVKYNGYEKYIPSIPKSENVDTKPNDGGGSPADIDEELIAEADKFMEKVKIGKKSEGDDFPF